MDTFTQLHTAAQYIKERSGVEGFDTVVVLGSGLGRYAERLESHVSIEYQDIPGFPIPKAVGHSGVAHSVKIGQNQVLIFSGRVHFFEGYPINQVVFAVRTAIAAGCRQVILTNASGGCGEGIERGDLVLLTDYINLAGASPLRGENDDRLGPRFPDMTDVYSPRLRELAHQAGRAVGTELKEGVYCWFQGPMFESPAEIQMAKTIGADLVGMSTVPETIAARHMGAEVLGISLCTNLAAGISDQPITSEEVMETGAQSAERMGDLMDRLLSTF